MPEPVKAFLDRRDWQDALGWVAVSAFAWRLVLHPIALTVAPFLQVEIPPLPALDWTEAGTMLGAALGLGWLRRSPLDPETK